MIKKETSKLFRGLAVIMVVASHYAEWIDSGGQEELSLWMTKLGAFGVDIFFFLSGYGLARAAIKAGVSKEFILRRGFSVYFPYLLVITVLELIDGIFLSPDKSWFAYFTGDNYWFMTNLFLFYLFFFFCWKIKVGRNLLLLFLVLIYSYYLVNIGRLEFWYISNIAFVMGTFVGDKEELWKDRFREAWAKPAGLILVLASLYVGKKSFALPEEMGTLIFLHFLFTLGVMLLISKRWFRGGALSVIGSYSLYVYLLHTRLFHGMYWKWDMLEGIKRWGAVFSCSILISIVVGFISQDIILKGVQKLWAKDTVKKGAANEKKN